MNDDEESECLLDSGISNELIHSPLLIGFDSKARCLKFIKCLAVTFSEIIDPPHVPQPNVNEGLKAVVTPTAPTEEGVFTRILNAGFSNANFIIIG